MWEKLRKSIAGWQTIWSLQKTFEWECEWSGEINKVVGPGCLWDGGSDQEKRRKGKENERNGERILQLSGKRRRSLRQRSQFGKEWLRGELSEPHEGTWTCLAGTLHLSPPPHHLDNIFYGFYSMIRDETKFNLIYQKKKGKKSIDLSIYKLFNIYVKYYKIY